jgi:8-oxo-dGTP diphosphatase
VTCGDGGEPAVVVGAAIVAASPAGPAQGLRVLAAQRSYPPRLAGQWEFPGGKVEAGESEIVALRRECREELGVDVEVGTRIGPDLPVAHGAVLRIYLARLQPRARLVPTGEHARLRWLAAHELESVPWLAPDRPVLGPLAEFLRAGVVG